MEISEKQASGIESKSISPDETELLNYTRQSPSAPFLRSREFQAHHLRVDIAAMPIPIHKVKPAVLHARGSQCRSCGKMNHFPRCCRSKPIRPLFAESSSPVHARFATLPTLNNTLPLMMSIFSQ
jgi:hypothetical protein